MVERTSLYDTYNAAYVQAVFDQYMQNPAAVDEAWRRFFENGGAQAFGVTVTPAPAAPTSDVQIRAAMAAAELVDAYRLHGHRAARLDPLGLEPPGHPALDPRFHDIDASQLAAIPSSPLGLDFAGANMADVLSWLRATYTGSIGYEFEFLEDPGQREWLRDRIETAAHRPALDEAERIRLLERLTQVEGLEQFIHKSYLGAKRFSIEGTDMMVPMLDLAIERAAATGAAEIVIGMAHRGRLNVLAHVVGMPVRNILGRFEDVRHGDAGTGDVKYHLGAEGTYATRSGEPLTVLLAPNPSHLEFVNAVVEGMTRAKQTDRTHAVLTQNEDLVVPILIHGDAAFSGQGVVAETLNLARLVGYRTGGTLHIIANNQVGFTTNPSEGRSTDYASDLARGFDIPVFHVNADDPEACLAVVRLAMEFRAEFHSDVVIDLIGYRRYGHNEADEPAYTQPVMYKKIAEHPTVRRIWAAKLVEQGVIDDARAQEIWDGVHEQLIAAQDDVRSAPPPVEELQRPREHRGPDQDVETAVDEERLRALDRQIHAWPEDFKPNPKLERQLRRRSEIVPAGGSIDWAHAEALAFASLLTDGVPIRLTGQDTERGTFSQRHLVLHGFESDRRHVPLASLEGATAPFEIHNSPLSELAAVGFEYGYSVVAPKALVLWEAQFGDFVNGAQVIIDQFLAAGYEKWGQRSRLGLLLPHGYEGQGPEHSSARLERFLQLAAERNLRVANCSTPAQYFHILRRQAFLPARRPLILMTPKSLLRHPKAVSPVAELAQGGFHPVIDDPSIEDRAAVRRVVLCSGKVYYDLLAGREENTDVALVRVELLYPLAGDALSAAIAAYANAREVFWVQEEPENMGAWHFMERRLRTLVGDERTLRYVGRPERASPAEGYFSDHEREQKRIVDEAVRLPAAKRASSRRGARTA